MNLSIGVSSCQYKRVSTRGLRRFQKFVWGGGGLLREGRTAKWEDECIIYIVVTIHWPIGDFVVKIHRGLQKDSRVSLRMTCRQSLPFADWWRWDSSSHPCFGSGAPVYDRFHPWHLHLQHTSRVQVQKEKNIRRFSAA